MKVKDIKPAASTNISDIQQEISARRNLIMSILPQSDQEDEPASDSGFDSFTGYYEESWH